MKYTIIRVAIIIVHPVSNFYTKHVHPVNLIYVFHRVGNLYRGESVYIPTPHP